MARGLTPPANSRKIRRTTAASASSIRRAPGHRPSTDAIAVGPAAGGTALQHPAELAAPGLLLEVGQEHLRHGAEQADMHRGDRADIDGVQRDAAELEPVVQGGDVGELAAQPVDRLDDDDVERAALGIGQQGAGSPGRAALAPEIARSS